MGFHANGKLKRSPTAGGDPVDIGSVPGLQGKASWGDEDFIVFTPGFRDSLLRIPADGGESTAVTHLKEIQISHRNPFVLPGSRGILYQNGVGNRGEEIWIKDLVSGEVRFLIQGGLPHYYDGRVVFFRYGDTPEAGTIWVVNFDLDGLIINGEPEPIIQIASPSFAINNTGSLVYAVPSPKSSRLLLLNQSEGKIRVIEDDMEVRSFSPRFSPNGKSLAMPLTSNGQTDIWIYDLSIDGSKKQLSRDRGEFPVWSLNGEELAYLKRGTGIVVQETGASRPSKVLIEYDEFCYPLQWNAHGILYLVVNKETQGDLYFITNDGVKTVIQNDEVATSAGHISPDDAWIAVTRYETEAPEVWVERFPDGGLRQRVPVANGTWPKWSADGTSLYVTSDDRLMRVPVTRDGGGIKLDKPAIVHEVGSPAGLFRNVYDVSSEEGQFALLDIEYLDHPVMVMVTDWPDALID